MFSYNVGLSRPDFILGSQNLCRLQYFPFWLALKLLLIFLFSFATYVLSKMFVFPCTMTIFDHSSQNFDILHGVDLDTVKTSLFELKNWSGIFCPEAKQNEDFASRRRQSSHENSSMSNGFHDIKATKKGLGISH